MKRKKRGKEMDRKRIERRDKDMREKAKVSERYTETQTDRQRSRGYT